MKNDSSLCLNKKSSDLIDELVLNFIKNHPFFFFDGDSEINKATTSILGLSLLGIFFLDLYYWDEHGVLKEKAKSTDPLKQNDVSSFLIKNPAVKAFRLALERNLSILKHKKEDADKIIEDAAKRVYPDYHNQIENFYQETAMRYQKTKASPYIFIKLITPLKSSPIWEIPEKINLEYKNILIYLLTKCIEVNLASENQELFDWHKKTLKMLKKMEKLLIFQMKLEIKAPNIKQTILYKEIQSLVMKKKRKMKL